MPNRFAIAFLSIGILLTTPLAAGLRAADDWSSDNSLGTTPMAPSAMPSSPGWQQRSIVPGPPVQPSVPTRPGSWPGSPVDMSGISTTSEPVPGVAMQACEGARIVARVGADVVLEGDVMGDIIQWLENNKDRIPASQLEAIRNQRYRDALRNRIMMKLVWQDAKRKVPAESWSKVEKEMEKRFEDFKLPEMMKTANVTSRADLDEKLRALGTSLERAKRAFIELTLAQGWIGEQIKPNKETTYDQMVQYYRQHQDEFTTPARVQYEELMVRFSKYPNKNAAYEAIARMGNQVLAGAPFADVAKAGSDGATAADGGQRPWTNKGGLAWEQLDQALFSMPVGQLSPIMEGPLGFHIVRVTQREELAVQDFLAAQADIKDKIVKERNDKQLKDYLARLEAKTPVWTVFESDISNPQLSRRPTQQR